MKKRKMKPRDKTRADLEVRITNGKNKGHLQREITTEIMTERIRRTKIRRKKIRKIRRIRIRKRRTKRIRNIRRREVRKLDRDTRKLLGHR